MNHLYPKRFQASLAAEHLTRRAPIARTRRKAMSVVWRHSRDDPKSWLGIDGWEYDTFFEPLPSAAIENLMTGVHALMREADLPSHPFFSLAESSKALLELWVSQELVMTNAFSQLVLLAAARTRNVHARAVLTEVASGEHVLAKDGTAFDSHPWLLERLRASLSIPKNSVTPLLPVVEFIERLESSLSDPMAALAYIGIGNEMMIVPEYRAIKRCFRTVAPSSDYNPFPESQYGSGRRSCSLVHFASSQVHRRGKRTRSEISYLGQGGH